MAFIKNHELHDSLIESQALVIENIIGSSPLSVQDSPLYYPFMSFTQCSGSVLAVGSNMTTLKFSTCKPNGLYVVYQMAYMPYTKRAIPCLQQANSV